MEILIVIIIAVVLLAILMPRGPRGPHDGPPPPPRGGGGFGFGLGLGMGMGRPHRHYHPPRPPRGPRPPMGGGFRGPRPLTYFSGRKGSKGKHADCIQWMKQGGVLGAALRFLQAPSLARSKNRLSARGLTWYRQLL